MNLTLAPDKLGRKRRHRDGHRDVVEPVDQDVTINLAFAGTASGADYSTSGASIVITAGNTNGSIVLTGIDDLTDEPNESIVVDVTSVINAQRTAHSR